MDTPVSNITYVVAASSEMETEPGRNVPKPYVVYRHPEPGKDPAFVAVADDTAGDEVKKEIIIEVDPLNTMQVFYADHEFEEEIVIGPSETTRLTPEPSERKRESQLECALMGTPPQKRCTITSRGSPEPGASGLAGDAFVVEILDVADDSHNDCSFDADVSGGSAEGAEGCGGLLVERFADDEQLPDSLKEDFERLTNERARRERVAHERRANRAVEEDVDENEDVEDDFFDCGEFVWRPMNEWNGSKESFLPQSSGPTGTFESVYDAFRAYWDDSMLSHIVTETNRHAQGIESDTFQRDWIDTNLDEILILFAFWMMLGIIKMPSIKSCFSKLSILRTDVFRTMFSEERYWSLNRAFHLARGSRPANDPDNLLYPMGPIIDMLNAKFQRNYRLSQDICIDESLTLWKGPVAFKQYIKTKSARFGIKTYQLCESATGYLWSLFVYVGRRTHTSTLPASVSTVLQLMQPLLDLGHVLYMDNWFNSPKLARYLKRHRTDCVGTLRPNRQNVPAVIQRAPLAEGEFVARQSGDVMLVALQDRKRLTCISTFHDVSQVQKDARRGRPAQHKLSLIDDYNHGMGGVDRLDQMLEPYLVERKQCVGWTRKLFKRLLNITVQNSRILLEKCRNKSIASLAFRLELVQSIMDRHNSRKPRKPEQIARPRHRFESFPATRLTERHFIQRIPMEDEDGGRRRPGNRGRRTCVWCTAHGIKCKRTSYWCPSCQLPMCLEDCFEQFHTVRG